jgi:ribose transport system substrate-binding protein
MKKSMFLVLSALMAISMALAACQTATPAATTAPAGATTAPVVATTAPLVTIAPQNPGLNSDAAKVDPAYFDQKEMDLELSLMDKPALNPTDPIYEQYLVDNTVQTTQYKKAPPYTICFSNSGIGNPWRVTGLTDMVEEAKLHTIGDPNNKDSLIKKLVVVDAQSKDEKQIADIADLVAGKQCDILIVASNTTIALTPAIDAACAAGLPVIEFDRYSQSTCPIVKERSIGGYAFGAAAAQFIIKNLPNGGNVLALRILPGVDVLEQRWGAARQLFEKAGNINIIGVEFTNDDNATTKSIVSDYIARFGKVDAVWMDAGATSVAALEAFSDAGVPYGIVTGEDQEDYLQMWKADNLTAIAVSFSTYQWRTAIIAALKVLQGQPVQGNWYLPQPSITKDNLDQYLDPQMVNSPNFYAMCGCQDMPTYPAAWQAK